MFDKIPLEESAEQNKIAALQRLEEILSRLPVPIKELIEQAYLHRRIPKEFTMTSIFFAFSNAAGLAFKTNHNGYTNHANLYFALIGSRGDAKSPAMSLATSVLNVYDDIAYKEYQKNKKELTDNNNAFEAQEVDRNQSLIQNATIEAAMYTHFKNPYSVGLYVDELFSLIEKMANNNSSEGASWRTFLLQGFTNHHIDVLRRTSDSYRIPKSYPTLLGSIQHQFIPKMFANGNLESGFIDRILFTTPLTQNTKLSKGHIMSHVIKNYNTTLESLLTYRKHMEKEKNTYTLDFEKDSEEMMNDYLQVLISKKDKLPNMEEEYNAKMQITIYKITILIHLMKNSINNGFQSKITVQTVDLAILINEFYFTNFKIVISNKKEVVDKKLFLKELIGMAKKNEVPQKDIVALTGMGKSYISKLWKR